MPLPADWNDYLFPAALRTGAEGQNWHHAFGLNRRTYVLGYSDAATLVGRSTIESIKAGLSPRYKEDPRRYIPLTGWRSHFRRNGETFAEGNYTSPPPERRHARCQVWGAFGKDQPEYAWLGVPMRAPDALKALAALFDAQDQAPGPAPALAPSIDGIQHPAGHLSLHPAVFDVDGFDRAYFDAHFASNGGARQAFADAAGLFFTTKGVEVPTLYELACGLSVTHRTAQALIDFAAAQGLPPVGKVRLNRALRGTNRDERQKIKGRRPGYFKNTTSDCALEVFV